MKRLLCTPLLLLFSFLITSTPSFADEPQPTDQHKISQERCLTTHGVHSAKALGLVNSDWKVPKENICGPSQN